MSDSSRSYDPDTSSADRKYLVVVGAGSALYREYALRSVTAAHPVILVDSAPPKWAVDLVAEAVTSSLDAETLCTVLAELDARMGVAGVMTYSETAVPACTAAAAALGLPHYGIPAAQAARDKGLTREALARAGVASAVSHVAASADHAVELAREIGFPVVVKPRTLAAAMGVTRADDEESVAVAFLEASGASMPGAVSTGVLIEEYLEGPEISIECVSQGGVHVIAAVTRKEIGFAPHFEQLSHIVDAADPARDQSSPIARVARDALGALGVLDGVSHIEARLTSRGPRIIEVNSRLAGDMIPYLVREATGIDLSCVAADVALGLAPDLTQTRSEAAGVAFQYPDVLGHVRSVTCDEALTAQPWLNRMDVEHAPGDFVQPPPLGGLMDRVARVIVNGPDLATCEARLKEALASIQVVIDSAERAAAPAS